MVSATELITTAVILSVIGASAYGMYLYFGFVGVGVFGLFTIPIALMVVRLVSSNDSNARVRRHDSKGAREK